MQISDSHIGFDKPANTDVTATLREAIAKIKASPEQPSFVLHTGDLTHLSKPSEFDTLQQVMSELSLPVFYVPGEHDVLADDGKSFLQRYRQGHARRRLAQLRQGRRPLHRPGERRRSQGRRARHAGARAARVAREGRQAPEEQHADRRLRAHPALVGVSGLGLGHRRQRPGARLSEAIWIGVGAERTHPPGDAEGRRTRHVSHGDVDGVSAARTGYRRRRRDR